jgi:lysophospholipase L1-like esterase
MTIRRSIFVTVALIGLIAASGATPASRNDGPPTSIAALGDSITAAACADGVSCSDILADSWSTGTNPAVQSHLRRLQAIWKSHPVRAVNLASDAYVTMASLAGQALAARHDRADYITIEIGENDLCGSTPIATFRTELEHGLAVLEGGTLAKRPPPKILLLSIENIVAHWRVLHADPAARKAFKSGYSLDCALGNHVPASWIAQIEARVRALNAVEAEVCSSVPYCLYDGGTYYHLPLRARYFSPADYQHLSVAGQRALAAAEWRIALKFLYD